MIQFDSHIHTYPFSQDAKQDIVSVLNAHANSSYGYILTEHMDYNYTGKICFEFNPKEYFEKYGPYRNDKFLLGVEMGLQPDNYGKIEQTLSQYSFDMVIGSIHTVGEDIAYPAYYEKMSKIEAYQRYLVRMLECLEHYHNFDTLAHIDYICRYSTYEDPEMHVADHRAALAAVFQQIIDQDICLEINTRRLGTENGYDTLNEILRLYAYMGGRLVTVGSDSHKIENLACNFDKAEKLIKEHNLVPVYFKNRKRIE